MRGRVDLYDEETKLLVARIFEDPEQRSIVWAGEFGGRILIHVRCAALLRFNEEQTAFEIFSKTAHYGHCASTSSENWLAMPDFEDSTSRIKLWRNPKDDECSQVLSSTGAENWMPICIHLREELKAVFIGWDSGCIDRVDAETSQQLARISLGAEPIFSIVATSRRLFCSTSAPPIRVLDVAEAGLKSCEQQIGYAASANGCSCLSLSPSGKTVLRLQHRPHDMLTTGSPTLHRGCRGNGEDVAILII
ncbi:unnamed protein product, partial [Mesorhabditis spiculigera]